MCCSVGSLTQKIRFCLFMSILWIPVSVSLRFIRRSFLFIPNVFFALFECEINAYRCVDYLFLFNCYVDRKTSHLTQFVFCTRSSSIIKLLLIFESRDNDNELNISTCLSDSKLQVSQNILQKFSILLSNRTNAQCGAQCFRFG